MQLNFILGTAAELIKVYPVIHLALERGAAVRVLSTGQSRENFRMQYQDLRLPEAAFVTFMESSGDLERARSAVRWFARALGLSSHLVREKLLTGSDAYVVVHGDTLSTLVGAWQGRRARLPVVHIEAGLRSPNLLNPFPEEITRRLVSRLATIHVPPDAKAEANLRRAGVRGQIVCSHGNTLMDAVRLSASLDPTNVPSSPYALVNIHRFENLNSKNRWNQILEVVARASERTPLVFVCHPQTRHKLDQYPEARAVLSRPGIEIRDRMPFSAFIALLKGADFLITDGGSNQEECSYLGMPCLILREATERSEGLDTCCVLSRFDSGLIEKFLEDPQAYRTASAKNETSPSAQVLLALKS